MCVVCTLSSANSGQDRLSALLATPASQRRRWHQTLKNRILLDNYCFPADLDAQIETFVDHYNHQCYHESINNLTPADVYFGRGPTILLKIERIKQNTLETRCLQHRKNAAKYIKPDELNSLLAQTSSEPILFNDGQ